MCEQCGCNQTHNHHHAHEHDGKPHTHPSSSSTRQVEVQASATALNQRYADANRDWFKSKGLTVFNFLSAPGTGKTAWLEATLRLLPRAAVIVGDLQTDNDAVRLRRSGAQAIQITTGATCHLDAHMVAHALEQLDTDNLDYVFIENVGNLVCPASYDLGETYRVVLLSVTEGEDKPLKYPVIFHSADAVVITKMDLAAAVEFNRTMAGEHLRRMAPRARLFAGSAKTGDGMEEWLDWVRQNHPPASGS